MMFLLLAEINRLWFAPLLIVGISLVYAATRYEDMKSIFRHACGFGVWTVVFMIVVGVVLESFAYFQ